MMHPFYGMDSEDLHFHLDQTILIDNMPSCMDNIITNNNLNNTGTNTINRMTNNRPL